MNLFGQVKASHWRRRETDQSARFKLKLKLVTSVSAALRFH
jgi:hypothetical protein